MLTAVSTHSSSDLLPFIHTFIHSSIHWRAVCFATFDGFFSNRIQKTSVNLYIQTHVINAMFRSALTPRLPRSESYLSEDWVDDGSQLPPVSLLHPEVLGVSNGGRQTQGLGLVLRRPLYACWTPSPEWLNLLLDGTLKDRTRRLMLECRSTYDGQKYEWKARERELRERWHFIYLFANFKIKCSQIPRMTGNQARVGAHIL